MNQHLHHTRGLLLALFLFLLSPAHAREVQSYRDLRYTGVVGQTSDYTCGPAALATLLTHYYGTPVSEAHFTELATEDMAKRGKQVLSGLTMLSLKNALATEGISAEGYKIGVPELRALTSGGLPVLVNVQYPKGHYYLVIDMDDENVLLADPSWGMRSQSIQQFLHAWNGVVLVPQPSEAQAAHALQFAQQQKEHHARKASLLRRGI